LVELSGRERAKEWKSGREWERDGVDDEEKKWRGMGAI
jgi:hypothetical protein